MQAPQMSPQAAPQPQQPPMGQPPQQASAPVPAQPQGSPQQSGRQGQNYNPDILPLIEKHLNTLPKEQQQFLTQYMTPELAMLFGIVMGHEALDYFKKFADPKKMLVVQPRPQDNQQASSNGAAAQQSQQQPPAPQVQPQATNTPQANIMGV